MAWPSDAHRVVCRSRHVDLPSLGLGFRLFQGLGIFDSGFEGLRMVFGCASRILFRPCSLSELQQSWALGYKLVCQTVPHSSHQSDSHEHCDAHKPPRPSKARRVTDPHTPVSRMSYVKATPNENPP